MALYWEQYTQGPTIVDSLVRLKFSHACIDPDSLSELVLTFPSLKDLYIENCAFVYKSVETLHCPALINLEGTSLDTITLHWSGRHIGDWMYQYSKMHLRIHLTSRAGSNQGEKYQHYALETSEITTITPEQYKEELQVDPVTYLSFDITCVDISAIKIKINDLPREIILNLNHQ